MGRKPPQDPKDIFPELVEDLRQALADDLVSVTVFGSAAGGRYRKGHSDINLLVVVRDQAGNQPQRLIPFAKKWSSARVATPLLLTPTYLASSQDVFPLEFMVMAAEHQVLAGDDPLAGVDVQPRYLRLQLERELRGKLLNLRSRIISSQARKAELMILVGQALPALKALFKAYLQLTTGAFPNQPEEIMQAMARQGHRMESLNRLYQVRQGQIKAGTEELLKLLQGACEELQTLTREVDSLAVEQGA